MGPGRGEVLNQREQNREALRVAGLLEMADALREKFNARILGFVDYVTGYKAGQELPKREEK